MIMGDFCTGACKFCAVKTLAKPPPLDIKEPEHLAEAIKELDLNYVVITSVDRDDLNDGGAPHFAQCVSAVREKSPKTIIETLIPDFSSRDSSIRTLVDSMPDVVSHNLETVERLTPKVRDQRANYKQSLGVLRKIRQFSKDRIITKSGLMVGLGETTDEIRQSMQDLLDIGVEIITIGQYLRPSDAHLPVKEFIIPEKFKEYENLAYESGFKYVTSGPLVRSSFKAAEPFLKNILKSKIH
jgi:lipoic acid synthetase